MCGIGNLKVLCYLAETLQERIRRFPDEEELLAAVRAVGMSDPIALSDMRSAAIERQSCYVLVPVLWNAGDLNAYRKAGSHGASLFMLGQRLVRDAMVQSELFHNAGNRFMDYLSLWAQELNCRGDEMYRQNAHEDKKLTHDIARFVASLECMHSIAHESMRVEELLGTPLLQSSDNHGDVDYMAVISLVACLADLRLNGTLMNRLKADIDCTPDIEEGPEQEVDPERLDAIESPALWPDQIEIEGQRFYPEIEAQEVGAALYLAELIA
ncbi:hypothetical protein B5F33_04060 [Collinsella sp. An2]|nr:hypothetical protein B5F33_04060 [Collinsella sp. An2]